MALFEALYGKGYRSPIGWFEAGDVKPLGVDLEKDIQDKVRSIQTKIFTAQSRQKKYEDHKVRDMAFQTVVLDKDLQYEEEPIAILDCDVCKLRIIEIKSVKVQLKHHTVEKATWETEKDMRDKYPQLFVDSDSYDVKKPVRLYRIEYGRVELPKLILA
ncbi:hypothetical protein MTR67_042817 [Solanum verrucosum]|uniref:Uncharacterized protein n=1 Tax=Solanum verrucosum TaxID=315347 RepID=A0AAF0UNB1_SOLVR|nr:hypothetical protein MTR67_042817 [Solanum verrucosum]